MRAHDQSSIFSTGGKFRPDYGLLLELHTLTQVARSYALLVKWLAKKVPVNLRKYHTHPWLTVLPSKMSKIISILFVGSYNKPLYLWYILFTHNLLVFIYTWSCLVTTPHLKEERVWWCLPDPLGFITINYFLERNFSPPIALQKTQSVVQHRKFLATSARWYSTFLV